MKETKIKRKQKEEPRWHAMTTKEASQYYGIGIPYLHKLINEGNKVGIVLKNTDKNTYVFYKELLDEFLGLSIKDIPLSVNEKLREYMKDGEYSGAILNEIAYALDRGVDLSKYELHGMSVNRIRSIIELTLLGCKELDKYLKFDDDQLIEIKEGYMMGIDVSGYANKETKAYIMRTLKHDKYKEKQKHNEEQKSK